MTLTNKEFVAQEIAPRLARANRRVIAWRYVHHPIGISVAVFGALVAGGATWDVGGWEGLGLMIGILTAISTALNPSKKYEISKRRREALEALSGAVRFRGLPLSKATRLLDQVRAAPETVIQAMVDWTGPESLPVERQVPVG